MYFDYEKIAVVTDDDHWKKIIKFSGFLMPCEVKLFGLAQLDQAKEWISS